MKLVADTNILFSFFWRDSLTRQILVSKNIKIFSPEFAILELNKYSGLIINKTKISKKEFASELNKLKSLVKFYGEQSYNSFMNESKVISPDRDDAHFLALCLRMNLPLWSNDKELKKQNKVIILNTKDIVDIYLG